MEDAKLNNDTVATYYWYGRLANVVVIFDPLKEDKFEERDVAQPAKKGGKGGKKLLAEIVSLLDTYQASALALNKYWQKQSKTKATEIEQEE